MENLRQPKVGDVWARKGSGTRYTILSVGPGGVKGRCKSSFDFDMVRPTAWNDGEGIEGFHENFKLILGAAEFVPAVGDAIGEKSTGEWFILTSVHVTPIGEYGEPPKWSLKGRAWVKGAAPTATGKKWRWQGNGGNFHYGRHLVPKAQLDTIWAQEQAKGRLAKAAEELSVAHGMSEWARNMTTKIANHAFLYGMGSARTIFSPGQQAGRSGSQVLLRNAGLYWTPPFGPVKPRLSAGWEHLPCVTHPELPADGSYWEDIDGMQVFCSGRVWKTAWNAAEPVERIRFYLLPQRAGWLDTAIDLSLADVRSAWPRMKPLLRMEGACPHDRVRPSGFYKGALAVGVDFAKSAEVSRDTQAVTVGSYWRGKTTGVLTYVLDLECDGGIRISRQEYVRGEGKVWGSPITVRSGEAFRRNYFLATEPSDDRRHSDDPKFLVKPRDSVVTGTYWTDKNLGVIVYVAKVSWPGESEITYAHRGTGTALWLGFRTTKDRFLALYQPYPTGEGAPASPHERHPSDPKFIATPPPAPILPKRHDYFWKKNVPAGTSTLIHVYDVNEAEGYVLFHEKKMEPGAKWSWNQYASGGLENWVKSYTTGRRFKMLFWENMHPTDPDKAKAQARQMPAPKPTPKPVGDALFWLGAEGE